MKRIIGLLMIGLAFVAGAADIKLQGVGAEKLAVQVQVGGAQGTVFTKTLKRNLEISGCFKIAAQAPIKVYGDTGTTITFEGRGKVGSMPSVAADDRAARMEARRLADKMVESLCNQKGFACDSVAFVSKQSSKVSELMVCYPDGQDIRQLTADKGSVVGPRWKNGHTLLYTGIRGAGPQIFEYDLNARKRLVKWSFKGLNTGAVVSPDGTKAAIILSAFGNPELCVIDLATSRYTRLTTTPTASEGQPSWSPDGRQIVYVSDETRHPQLYIIDIATKAKRRLTSTGSQNVDPDWGRDGRIAYITKRGGLAQIAVIDPAKGEKSCQLIAKPGSWEHPSWSKNGRHLVASRDRAMFIVDTAPDYPEEPKQLFFNSGDWVNPCWAK